MKIKTSELTGAALDWVVLRILEQDDSYEAVIRDGVLELWHNRSIGTRNPTLGMDNQPRCLRARDRLPVSLVGCPTSVQTWSYVGPIMDEYNIDVRQVEEGQFTAHFSRSQLVARKEGGGPEKFVYSYCGEYGPSRIVAVLRCFVTFKVGPVADIPEELA